ncbi:MAG: hypothetical protein CMM55_07735 [Rhodospirillaceae bacterium]|nr:hypothetical protein [Rhodospirillaceae bacterium]
MRNYLLTYNTLNISIFNIFPAYRLRIFQIACSYGKLIGKFSKFLIMELHKYEVRMAQKYNNAQHKQYLEMIDGVGRRWIEVFEGNTEFYSAAYWDLLTGIWRADGPVRKTDALRYMTAIKSAHTASKYVDHSIMKGILIESDNPDDARSKLLVLSDNMREQLNIFFDAAVGSVRRANRAIDEKGPSPEDP